MKKVLAFLFAVVIMCSASAALLTASAAGKSTVVTLKPYIYSEKDKTYTKVSSVKGGDTLYVSVELTSVSAVGGFSLRLKYDSSVFGFEKAKVVNNTGDGNSEYLATAADGAVTLSWDTLSLNTTLSGPVFYLPFTVDSKADQSNYTFSAYDVEMFESNKNQSNIKATVAENASVTVENITVPSDFLELVSGIKSAGINYNPNNLPTLPKDSLSDINSALEKFSSLTALEQSAFYNNYRDLYDFLTNAKNEYYKKAQTDSEALAREEADNFLKMNAAILNTDFKTLLGIARKSTEEEFSNYVSSLTSSYDGLSAKAKALLSDDVVKSVKRVQDNGKAAERTVKFETRYSTYIGDNYAAVLANWENIHSTDYIYVSEALAAYNALPQVARDNTAEYGEQLNNLLKLHISYSADSEHEEQILEKVTEFQNRYLYVFMLNSNNVTAGDRGAINMVLDAWNSLEDAEVKERLSSRIAAIKALLDAIEEDTDVDELPANGGGTENTSGGSVKTETVTKTKTNTVTKLLNKIYSTESGLRTPFVILLVMLLFSVVTAIVSMYLWTVAKTRENREEDENAEC